MSWSGRCFSVITMNVGTTTLASFLPLFGTAAAFQSSIEMEGLECQPPATFQSSPDMGNGMPALFPSQVIQNFDFNSYFMVLFISPYCQLLTSQTVSLTKKDIAEFTDLMT